MSRTSIGDKRSIISMITIFFYFSLLILFLFFSVFFFLVCGARLDLSLGKKVRVEYIDIYIVYI